MKVLEDAQLLSGGAASCPNAKLSLAYSHSELRSKILSLGKVKKSFALLCFSLAYSYSELRSKILPLGNAQINLAFRSLIRNFATQIVTL